MLSAFYSSFSSYLADCQLHSQPAMDLLHSGAYVMREDGSIVADCRAMRDWIAAALPTLENLTETEDFEDGGAALHSLINAGRKLCEGAAK